jgi:Tol biopolymer transport system component
MAQAPSAADTAPAAAPILVAQTDQLPDEIQALLALYGVDLERIGHLLIDPEGQWLLFATTEDILPTDRNGVSDIYRLDLLTEALSLLSLTPQGTAGNGPSRYPAADGSGELVVFQSDANDLVAGDTNQVSDVFLHDYALGYTERLTDAEGASLHPGIDASGTDVVYDQRNADGYRVIFSSDVMGAREGETLSLAADDVDIQLDNHHPAMSADGRYVAYLEQSNSESQSSCHVHVYDRDTEVYHRQVCPGALSAAAEMARPAFSAEADALHWYLPDQAKPLILSNPLHAENPQ